MQFLRPTGSGGQLLRAVRRSATATVGNPGGVGGRLEAEPTRAVPGGGEKYEYVDNDMTIDGEYTVDDYALDNEAAEAEGAEQTTLA